MKYCEDTTCNHPICSRFNEQVQLIATLLKAEGCNTKLFENEKAINLDKVEIELCRNNRCTEPTMDMTIGISKSGKNSQMLLVELKFNVDKPSNISKGDLEAKVKHSIEILGQETPIHYVKIIIFNNKQIAVAKSFISRLFGKPPKPIWEVKTAEEFKQEYFEQTSIQNH